MEKRNLANEILEIVGESNMDKTHEKLFKIKRLIEIDFNGNYASYIHNMARNNIVPINKKEQQELEEKMKLAIEEIKKIAKDL